MALRRSARLRGASTVERLLISHREVPLVPKERRKAESGPYSYYRLLDVTCTDADRRDGDDETIVPITSAELSLRERDIIRRERELRRSSETLAKKQLEIARAEEALDERSAKVALAQLEEHFQCPLCKDIIACPYVLTPAQCGHTFCALCTVKWFFSRLHSGCGGWHESVDCPMCRALLILTPDATPRSTITVPFAPNRVADRVLSELIGKLGSRSLKTRAKRTAEDCNPVLVGVDAWAEGGALRVDWLERDKWATLIEIHSLKLIDFPPASAGRLEMKDIIGRWKILEGEDFVSIKVRLGV